MYLQLDTVQVYAPQQSQTETKKDQFFENLQDTIGSMQNQHNLNVMGDINGFVGQCREEIKNVIGAFDIRDKNKEGERTINFL